MAPPVLEGDALDDAGHILALVGGFFEEVVDVAPLHDFERFHATLEEAGDRLAGDPVGFVLEAVDLDAVRTDPFPGHLVQRLRQKVHLGGLGLEVFGHRLHGLRNDLDVVEVQVVDRGLEQVHAVVEGQGQTVDVLAVDGSDERTIQPDEDLVGQVVGLGFEGGQLLGAPLDRQLPFGDVAHHGRTLDQVLGLLLEHLEELLVGRDQFEHVCSSLPVVWVVA